MSIKFTAIAAAAIATLGTASFADASYFEFQERLDADSVLELGTVTSQGNGVVEIYSFHGGELGALLGSEAVTAGANSDVRVNVQRGPDHDVIAVLKVDGQTVATRDYDIN
jgi:hypothetical protein